MKVQACQGGGPQFNSVRLHERLRSAHQKDHHSRYNIPCKLEREVGLAIARVIESDAGQRYTQAKAALVKRIEHTADGAARTAAIITRAEYSRCCRVIRFDLIRPQRRQ